VSKVFINSQAKYRGALNYHNYIPWGSTGIERFNVKEAKSSDWKAISISPFLYYGSIYPVYKFQLGFNLTTAQKRTGTMTRACEVSVLGGNQITAISLSPDGNKLAVGTMAAGSNLSTLSVYSVSAGTLLWAYNITDPNPDMRRYIKVICWDSDDRIAISFGGSSWTNEVCVFSSEGKLLWHTQLYQFKQWNHPMEILSMDWSPSHELVVVGHIFTTSRETEEDILVIFDSSGKELHRTRLPVGRTLYAEVRWSPDGSYLAFADYRCVALMSHDGRPLWNITQEIVVDAISWHPDAIGFAIGKWNELTFYSLEGEELFSGQVPGHVYDLVWSPDGGNLAVLADSKGQSMFLMMTCDGLVSWCTDFSRDRIVYDENADLVWNRAGLKLALIMNETSVVVYVVSTE
jgi:WD40 repeat protein